MAVWQHGAGGKDWGKSKEMRRVEEWRIGKGRGRESGSGRNRDT
jgi:hypothetical protein